MQNGLLYARGGEGRRWGSPQEKTRKVLPDGISGKQAHRARSIAAHPAEVEEGALGITLGRYESKK